MKFLRLIGLFCFSAIAASGLLSAQETGEAPIFSSKHLHFDHQHLIVNLPDDFSTFDRLSWEAMGAHFLRVLGPRQIQAVVPLSFDTAQFGARATRQRAVSAKIARDLVADTATNLRRSQGPSVLLESPADWHIVEFSGDVTDAEARFVLAQQNLTVKENPNLLRGHYLVHSGDSELQSLADWDEVEYVFPASRELVDGEQVYGCAGALTSLGAVSTSVPTFGDGWDGPGLGKATVQYLLSTGSTKVPDSQVLSELRRAMDAWSKTAAITFVQGGTATGNKTINILFASRDHGDGSPFDGPYGVLAHCFFPSPPNPEPIAGDLHFDADENWHVGSDIDVFSVALHELGHGIGLGHASAPGAVMYPYYHLTTALTDDDKNGALSLYAPAAAAGSTPTPPTAAALQVAVTRPASVSTTATSFSLAGTATGGTAPVVVTWATGNASGTATGSATWSASVPLALGDNKIVFTATDAAKATATTSITISRTQPVTPTVVKITTPAASGTYLTSTATLNLAGTVTGSATIANVKWTSDQGASGTATGTATWTISGVALKAGSNTITVTANTSSTGATPATAQLKVLYTPPTPPSITIKSPATSGSYTSTTSTVTVTGTVDNIGTATVKSVSWTSDQGGSGNATGTTNFSAGPITLKSGTNTISIAAVVGDATVKSTIKVSYTAPTVAAPTIRLTGVNPGGVGAVILVGTTTGTNLKPIAWSNDQGGSGTATGTATFSAGPIPLKTGTNTLTVSVTGDGGTASTQVKVGYQPAPTGPSTTVALTVTQPTSTTLSTTATTMDFLGTATGGQNLKSVTWANVAINGNENLATVVPGAAAASWKATIPLVVGNNTIILVGVDTTNARSLAKTFVVTRTK